jgi:hypothetical protein
LRCWIKTGIETVYIETGMDTASGDVERERP